jgi:hypothetical protein
MNQPALLQDSISESPRIYCNGGTTTLTVYPFGGTPIYTFSWTPSGNTNATLTGVSSGTYTVTVMDANGCSTTTIFNATPPAKLRDSISSVTNVPCYGGTGTATVGAKYGASPYTYRWSYGAQTSVTATGLSAGSYSVTVTDINGCTATASATLTQPSQLSGYIAILADVNCNGANNGSLIVYLSGGTTPYTYSWNPSGETTATATGLSAGTYTLTITDKNGCFITATAPITQPPVLNVSAISFITNVSCFGGNNGKDSAIVVGGTSPYTYRWAPNGGTKQTGTGLTVGNYTVTVTDNHGCTATSVGTINQPPLLTISANVTSNVTCGGGNNGAASSLPAGGVTPYTFLWSPGNQSNSNAANLTAGTYTITLKDNNGICSCR